MGTSAQCESYGYVVLLNVVRVSIYKVVYWLCGMKRDELYVLRVVWQHSDALPEVVLLD